tara:strand:+ start:2612 stop:3208 length:597 start_codon:yes stop_codon:yes gene_type:complete
MGDLRSQIGNTGYDQNAEKAQRIVQQYRLNRIHQSEHENRQGQRVKSVQNLRCPGAECKHHRTSQGYGSNARHDYQHQQFQRYQPERGLRCHIGQKRQDRERSQRQQCSAEDQQPHGPGTIKPHQKGKGRCTRNRCTCIDNGQNIAPDLRHRQCSEDHEGEQRNSELQNQHHGQIGNSLALCDTQGGKFNAQCRHKQN